VANLNPLQLQEIADQIRRGRCVPFLGAAANITSTKRKYNGLRLGYEVSEALAANLKPSPKDKKNLPRTSLLFERTVRRAALLKHLKQLLPDRERTPSPLLAILSALPFDLYITTNYDRLLERALSDRQPYVVVQTDQGVEGRADLDEWSAAPLETRRPLIYKIHGTFLDEKDEVDRSPLIVTEDDYISLLTILRSPEHGVPPLVTSRLARNTLLFLGYSLEDWDFRAIYKVLVDSHPDKRFMPGSYSVQKAPPKFWMDFWREKGVEILDEDVYAFAEELGRAYFGPHWKPPEVPGGA